MALYRGDVVRWMAHEASASMPPGSTNGSDASPTISPATRPIPKGTTAVRVVLWRTRPVPVELHSNLVGHGAGVLAEVGRIIGVRRPHGRITHSDGIKEPAPSPLPRTARARTGPRRPAPGLGGSGDVPLTRHQPPEAVIGRVTASTIRSRASVNLLPRTGSSRADGRHSSAPSAAGTMWVFRPASHDLHRETKKKPNGPNHPPGHHGKITEGQWRGPSGPPGQDWCGRQGRTGTNSPQSAPVSTRISTITNTNPRPPLGP